jgi:VCBS repeat-containing protein
MSAWARIPDLVAVGHDVQRVALLAVASVLLAGGPFVASASATPLIGDASGAVREAGATPGRAEAQGLLIAPHLAGHDAPFEPHTARPSDLGYGRTTVAADGAWTYQLDDAHPEVDALPAGASLDDRFVVRAIDGAEAVVAILIVGANDAPVATALLDRSAVDGEAVRVELAAAFGDPDAGDGLRFAAVGLPAGLAIDPDAGTVAGVLAADASTASPFDVAVTARDRAGAEASARFAWTVANVPPQAVSDGYATDARTPIRVAAPGVLANDAAPDGDVLRVVAVDGEPAGVGRPRPGSYGGSFTVAADGALAFDPGDDFASLRPGQQVATAIAIAVGDGEGGEDVVAATVLIAGVNDAPVVAGPLVLEVVDGPGRHAVEVRTVALAAADPDHAAEDLAWPSMAVPGRYGAWRSASDGAGRYEVDAARVDALPAGGLGVDAFAIAVVDPLGATGFGTVSVRVVGANDAPVARDAAAAIVAAPPAARGQLVADDPDVGDAVAFALVDAAPAGFVLADDGRWTFAGAHPAYAALAAGEARVLRVPYEVRDRAGAHDRAVLTLTVIGRNAAPTLAVGIDDVARAALASGGVVLTASGTLTVRDVDVADVVVADVARVAAVGLEPGIEVSDAAVRELFSVGPTPVVPAGLDQGTLAWNFASPAATFAAMRAGEVATLRFTVRVRDPSGAEATHDVVVSVEGRAEGGGAGGAEGDELVDPEPVAALPTVTPLTTSLAAPTIVGTFDAEASTMRSVTVAGATYPLGHPALVVEGGAWRVRLPSTTALEDGAYDVLVMVTDRDGRVLVDATVDEVVVDGGGRPAGPANP